MVDIDILTHSFFYFDKAVPYQLSGDCVIDITPVMIEDSELFMSCVGILTIDKNSSADVEIIQMSYLKYLIVKILSQSEQYVDMLSVISNKCLGAMFWRADIDKNGKAWLKIYKQEVEYKISAKQFDEISKIILHQNILHYDDTYVNPEIMKNINEQNRLKSLGYASPSLERKMAIITAHCGIPKKSQLLMTFREHQVLFEEVVGEVDYTTKRPAAIYAGKDSEIDHWIYKKQKNKLDGYSTSVEQFNKFMGGDGKIITATNTAHGDTLISQMNTFK